MSKVLRVAVSILRSRVTQDYSLNLVFRIEGLGLRWHLAARARYADVDVAPRIQT